MELELGSSTVGRGVVCGAEGAPAKCSHCPAPPRPTFRAGPLRTLEDP